MQSRWNLDKYLSYLSSPPLQCYCSSLWSPAKERALRVGETQRRTGVRREKDWQRGETARQFFFFMFMWEAMLWSFGHIHEHGQPDGQMDRQTTPSQGHKPARTAVRGSAESHTYQSRLVCVCASRFEPIWTGRSVRVHVSAVVTKVLMKLFFFSFIHSISMLMRD